MYIYKQIRDVVKQIRDVVLRNEVTKNPADASESRPFQFFPQESSQPSCLYPSSGSIAFVLQGQNDTFSGK
jgi:hypothetical protein